MTEPVIGSFCTGYGGLDMAARAVLGGRLAWVADPDPGPATLLAHHHPDIPNLGDITVVDFRAVEPVDVVCAGFPCQDLSYAGRGAGIREGTRSGLWHTIARALGVLRPRLVILENVAAITTRRPGLDVVLADLASLGLSAEWTCLRASDAGAPHHRERWFLVAWPATDPPHIGHEWSRHAWGRRSGPAHGRLTSADAQGARREGPGSQPAGNRSERGGRTATDPTRDGRNEGRPESARVVGGPNVAVGGGPAAADADHDGCIRRSERHSQPETRREAPQRDDTDRCVLGWGDYAPAIERWARVLGRPAPNPTEPGRNGRPRLSPPFVEWMMGLELGHVTAVPGLTRNQQLRLLGNGVVPQQGAAAFAWLLVQAAERAA